MRKLATVIVTCVVAGCGTDGEQSSAEPGGTAQSPMSNTRGGTVTVGEQNWTFVPSLQCSIYPNNQVNIAGHAEGDASFEIVVDYYPDGDGPTGLEGGKYGAMGSWRTVRESMQFEIDGRQLRGSGTFTVTTEQGQNSVEGSFDFSC